MCACPTVVGAASEAGAGGGRQAVAAGGAAQGAGGARESGAHNRSAQAADGPVLHDGWQPLSYSHPLHWTPERPLPTQLFLHV